MTDRTYLPQISRWSGDSATVEALDRALATYGYATRIEGKSLNVWFSGRISGREDVGILREAVPDGWTYSWEREPYAHPLADSIAPAPLIAQRIADRRAVRVRA